MPKMHGTNVRTDVLETRGNVGSDVSRGEWFGMLKVPGHFEKHVVCRICIDRLLWMEKTSG